MGTVRVLTVGFGLRASLGLDSRVWVFVGFLHLPSYITNWGSGLVPVYVKKSGSLRFCRDFRNPLHH